MPTSELLPGVSDDSCPPRVVCDAHAAIKRARRRVWLREALQLTVLLAADALFLQWPHSRMPFLDREHSRMLLQSMNLIVIADLWRVRAMPKWNAKRIASTWCRAERDRFRA
ncbi:MAG: hypothetical protein M3Q69_06970 [Acidobacteriota bacterium]|nr:hypothetical protein [Acidobacteriota bacterium]